MHITNLLFFVTCTPLNLFLSQFAEEYGKELTLSSKIADIGPDLLKCYTE